MKQAGVAVLALLCAAASAAAQDQQKLLEEERRRAMDLRIPTDEDVRQDLLWDAGGWINSEFITLDDPPDKDERTLRHLDLRLWGRLEIDRTYTVYLRTLTDYTDFNSGDQFEGDDDDDYRLLYVDQAWVEADWSSPAHRFVVRGGRQFLSLGRGLLFNQVAYGLTAEWEHRRWSARAFGAHSIIHDDDPDQSLTEPDDSYRAYGALEVSYALDIRHRAYFMALMERDLNDEDPESATQDWGYDSNYLGLGFRGSVFTNFGYHLEGIYEFGKSVAAASTEEEDIQAWALLATLDYRFQVATSPSLTFEYMFGSGDDDRGSVTEVASGNTAGTDDEGFLGFGFVQTGYSLFPRVSNIHIVRFGGSFLPLESTETFRYLEIAAFGYLYRKAEAAAPISDPEASLDDEDVGAEFDLLFRWRVLSDVGISVNFGRFLPGDAYDDSSARNFFSAGLTYSF